jgi:hypothetical protein
MASPSLRWLDAGGRAGRQLDLESLNALHTELVDERQRLRSAAAPAEELERNRLAIVECQWEVSRALIERYLPPVAAPSPA